MLLLVNRESGKGLAVTLFESEEATRRGDKALNAMSPGASQRPHLSRVLRGAGSHRELADRADPLLRPQEIRTAGSRLTAGSTPYRRATPRDLPPSRSDSPFARRPRARIGRPRVLW